MEFYLNFEDLCNKIENLLVSLKPILEKKKKFIINY